MANSRIGYGNCINTAIITGGSVYASLPWQNLQERTIGRVARTVNTALVNTKFIVDVGPDAINQMVAFVGHNISLLGRYRVRAGNDYSFGAFDYDSGWVDAWPAVYRTIDLSWQSPNFWSGRYLEKERQGYNWTINQTLDKPLRARYWLVEIDDVSNAAGFVQIGRGFIGESFQPRVNFDYGATVGWQTDTQVTRALSGAESYSKRTPWREAVFNYGYLSEAEAWGKWFDIQRRSGIDEEVFFQYNPDDTLYKLRREFLGTFAELSPINTPAGMHKVNSVAVKIKERI